MNNSVRKGNADNQNVIKPKTDHKISTNLVDPAESTSATCSQGLHQRQRISPSQTPSHRDHAFVRTREEGTDDAAGHSYPA